VLIHIWFLFYGYQNLPNTAALHPFATKGQTSPLDRYQKRLVPWCTHVKFLWFERFPKIDPVWNLRRLSLRHLISILHSSTATKCPSPCGSSWASRAAAQAPSDKYASAESKAKSCSWVRWLQNSFFSLSLSFWKIASVTLTAVQLIRCWSWTEHCTDEVLNRCQKRSGPKVYTGLSLCSVPHLHNRPGQPRTPWKTHGC
jgi:hypothetical protein